LVTEFVEIFFFTAVSTPAILYFGERLRPLLAHSGQTLVAPHMSAFRHKADTFAGVRFRGRYWE
jgi:hypothetical protein